ncbi:MAG: hypothetical protein AAB555_01030 [Patescibacteria group bacterium]
MRLPDLDKERSERALSFSDFMKSYNDGLPMQFPHVSLALLREFRKLHSTLFKDRNSWSLDQHRKKVMDWLTTKRA